MAGTTSFKRSLGIFELVSLGVGGTIGSGIFVVPGIAARLTGAASLYAWIIVALSASCILLSLSALFSRPAGTGSFFSLFESVFGKRVAAPIVILYIISSILGISTIAAGIGQYLSYFSIAHLLAIEIGIIAIFCLLNIIGISISGKAENVLTTLKIIPLVLIALLLLPFIKFENFATTLPLTAGGLFATIIIVYWPFTGFEISAIPIEETKDPRLIKRSLLYVMGIVAFVYLLLNISLIGSVGAPALASSPAPVALAAGLVFSYAGPLVALIGIIAMLSAMNAYIVGASRVMQSISASLSVPRFSNLGKTGTPVYATITGCGISAALLFISNHFDQLAGFSVITTLIPYIFFCTAAWILIPDTKNRIVSAGGAISTSVILLAYFLV